MGTQGYAAQTEIDWSSFCELRDGVRTANDSANESGEQIDATLTKNWQDERNRIVEKYYHLVERVAEQMSKKITEMEQDALASLGVDGLYDAVDGFKPELGIKFETYAVYRIRGAIIDGIRREDWVPRLVRTRYKKLERTMERLCSELGRIPNDSEMARAMGTTVEEYRELVKQSTLRSIQSLNATFEAGGDGRDDGQMSVMDCIPDRSAHEPLQNMMHEELKAKLFGIGFMKQEKIIVQGYYFEQRSMKEIADSINLSESRVSQINSAIMERLKDKIERNPEYFGKDALELLSRKTK